MHQPIDNLATHGCKEGFRAQLHRTETARNRSRHEVAEAMIHVYPRKFSDRAALAAPFPADPHFDAKDWKLCLARRGPGRVPFWIVTPMSRQYAATLPMPGY